MIKNMLAVPEPQEFLAAQFDEMITYLRDIDQQTVRVSINSAADLEMGADGRLLSNSFALSPLAFHQICRHVSKGLWSLATDIAGNNSGVRGFDSAVSIPLAVKIVNECIALRFRAREGLIGRDMIQDHDAGVIVGVVGPRYQLLPNHQLLEVANDMMACHEVKMAFHGGTLVGRRMSVSYLTAEPLVTTTDGPMYGGVYFTNSEAGECAVSGATLLQLGHTRRCINKPRHLKHAGKDFFKRLSHMLGGALHTWEKTVAVAHDYENVVAGEANFLTPSNTIAKAPRAKLEAAFAEYVDKSVANDVVRKVIFMGADGTHVPKNISHKDIATRRVRDIVLVAMSIANGHYPEVREGLERAAFDILARKVKLRS